MESLDKGAKVRYWRIEIKADGSSIKFRYPIKTTKAKVQWEFEQVASHEYCQKNGHLHNGCRFAGRILQMVAANNKKSSTDNGVVLFESAIEDCGIGRIYARDRVAIFDLDGPLADGGWRFDLAALVAAPLLGADGKKSKEYNNKYYDTAFDPDKIILDKPVPEAAQAIDFLRTTGWSIILLSSRPMWYNGSESGCSMEAATRAWLGQYSFQFDTLFLKPKEAQYISTPRWKALTIVHEILEALHPDAQSLMFVDDAPANLSVATSIIHESYDPSVVPSFFTASDIWSAMRIAAQVEVQS
jgi:hypothetical protein